MRDVEYLRTQARLCLEIANQMSNPRVAAALRAEAARYQAQADRYEAQSKSHSPPRGWDDTQR